MSQPIALAWGLQHCEVPKAGDEGGDRPRDAMTDPEQRLTLLALVGAGEPEIPVLAELHRNPRVHIIGVYDPDPTAIGHELAEILGLRHGTTLEFLEHIGSAHHVVLPRDRHRFDSAIGVLRERGASFLNHDEALGLFAAERIVTRPMPAAPPPAVEEPIARLEDAVRWLDRALDRDELLHALLSIAIQAAGADNGSVQLLDPVSNHLFIAYAQGLSDHTIRSSHQKLGEGIAGTVAATRTARLIQGEAGTSSGRDRPDIRSAVCVPLVDGERVLGVINVSCDAGSRRLERGDLERVVLVAGRISRVLARLFEIQRMYERALVDDLERELDRLYLMDGGLEQSLCMVRDLLQDLSGARMVTLVLLTPDGPACRVVGGVAPTRVLRDVDAGAGLLGQVLLTREVVVLEEKVRPAGERQSRRNSTLYVPIGAPEPFTVVVAEFDALSALTHFQSGLQHVVAVLTPRLGAMLARDESRGRLHRLRILAGGLASVAALPPEERPTRAAVLVRQLSGAEAVAVWQPGAEQPVAVELGGALEGRALGPLWGTLRARLRSAPGRRVRELEPAGSELRSLLLVGSETGTALAAINRVADGPMDELGFRDEDLDHSGLLLAALGGDPGPPPRARAAPAPAPEIEVSAATATPALRQQILEEAIERELARAQRYHFGFSITCFDVKVPAEDWQRMGVDLERRLQQIRRATDFVLWIGPQRFVVLAPEEAHGQRQLARRLQSQLQDFVRERLPESAPAVRYAQAVFPHDGDSPQSLLAACDRQLAAPAD